MNDRNDPVAGAPEGERDDPAAGAPGGRRAPVVVVGLGPVGATVALLVARAGAPVVAIERDATVYPHPRAVALDDDALRVLQAAGLCDGDGLDLRAGGTVRIRGRGGRPLVELGPPPTSNGHPGLAYFRQPALERALRARLEAEPLVDLRLGTTVLAVRTPGGPGRDAAPHATTTGRTGRGAVSEHPREGDAEGDAAPHVPTLGRARRTGRTSVSEHPREGDAVLRIAHPDGAEEDLRAAWVLACDGARSPIRTALGVRLRGTSSPSRWLVVDTDAPDGLGPSRGAGDGSRVADHDGPSAVEVGPPDDAGAVGDLVVDDFEFGADPRGPWVHGPLPGGAHRWEFLLAASTDSSRVADPQVVRSLLARRLTGRPVPAVHRAAVYAFHARVAERWRVGRILLLGDAAHLAPPFAGQGLCAGLRDAGNVGWKVAAAWHGSGPDDLLDTYAIERRPHVLRTTALAVALGFVVELRRPRAAAARDAVLRRIAATGAVRRWIARGGWRPPGTLRRGVIATDRRHRHRAGEALPQPLVRRTPDADPVPLDDLLPAGWVLLGDASDGAGRTLGSPRTRVAFADVADDGGLRGWIAPATVALVRPDRVVFGTAGPVDAVGLLDAAARWSAVDRGHPGAPDRPRSVADRPDDGATSGGAVAGRATGRPRPLGTVDHPPIPALRRTPMSTPDTPTHQVLFVLTGADEWTLVDGSKHPTGFWADELVAPHRVFLDAGWKVTIATPGGVTPPLDEGSLEPGSAGGDAAAADQRAYLDEIRGELEAAVAIESVDPRPFDVVYVPGGHGPMEDLAVHAPTGRLLTAMLDDDMKLVAAVCHGPAALLAARRADGSWPFAGRTLTAFTNEEEHQAGLGEVATWLLEDRLRDGGSAFEYGDPWGSFLAEDRNLHTGQNPASAGPLAERLVEIVLARDEALAELAAAEREDAAEGSA